MVNAEKESISKTSEREFYFVSERKLLTNITGTTSGKNNELAPLANRVNAPEKKRLLNELAPLANRVNAPEKKRLLKELAPLANKVNAPEKKRLLNELAPLANRVNAPKKKRLLNMS